MKYIIQIVFISSICLSQDRSLLKTALIELPSQSLLTIDYLQTMNIPRTKTHKETNIILGKRPGFAKISVYFAICQTAHFVIAHKIRNKKLQWLFQLSTIAIEGVVVYKNFKVGNKPFMKVN